MRAIMEHLEQKIENLTKAIEVVFLGDHFKNHNPEEVDWDVFVRQNKQRLIAIVKGYLGCPGQDRTSKAHAMCKALITLASPLYVSDAIVTEHLIATDDYFLMADALFEAGA